MRVYIINIRFCYAAMCQNNNIILNNAVEAHIYVNNILIRISCTGNEHFNLSRCPGRLAICPGLSHAS